MPELSQQDVQNLAMQHREYQKRAQTVQQQLNMIQISIEDCTRAIGTLDELSSADESLDTMFPIGSGSFIHGKLDKVDKVVVDVGAGVNVEKSAEDAKEILNKRKAEFQKGLERMNASLTQISQRIQSIESMIRENTPQ
ncbi:MAG: prefoldin subunit alpha [Methanosarcinaceae archaeon]|nr:prefoldin subunit alpha [Methanosarcinaceae archaeon]